MVSEFGGEAGHATVHGVLANILDLGVLIVGRPGIGKSACALELIDNGHQLIADDVVNIRRCGTTIYGSAPDAFVGMLEIRGLGICNVKDLFGETSITGVKEIGLCVEFQDHGPMVDDSASPGLKILGVTIPKVIFPVDGSRNLRVLVETAAKYFLLDGAEASRGFIDRYDASLTDAANIDSATGSGWTLNGQKET